MAKDCGVHENSHVATTLDLPQIDPSHYPNYADPITSARMCEWTPLIQKGMSGVEI